MRFFAVSSFFCTDIQILINLLQCLFNTPYVYALCLIAQECADRRLHFAVFAHFFRIMLWSTVKLESRLNFISSMALSENFNSKHSGNLISAKKWLIKALNGCSHSWKSWWHSDLEWFFTYSLPFCIKWFPTLQSQVFAILNQCSLWHCSHT